jgi:glycosyltransferase domain-containing protein
MSTYSNLNKLTLILLTYNRAYYALRNMHYWSGKQVELHVLDGSPEPIPKQLYAHLKNNIFYHYVPCSINERLRYSFDLVETDYVALLCDDEFHLPSALSASIQELDDHPDLVACMGRAIGFDRAKSGKVIGFPMYPRHKDYQVSQEEPFARIYDHMSNYACSTIYSVVRKEVWIKSHSAYANHAFPVFAIGELQFELLVHFFGKSKIIPCLHWLRSYENDPVSESGDISLDRSNRFHEWWTDPLKEEFRRRLVDELSEIIMKASTFQEKEVRSCIEEAMTAYVSAGVRRRKSRLAKKSKPRYFKHYIKRKILSCLPKQVIVFLKNQRKERRMSLLKTVQELSYEGVTLHQDELAHAINFIAEFHYSR